MLAIALPIQVLAFSSVKSEDTANSIQGTVFA